jgi:hypothetical protein
MNESIKKMTEEMISAITGPKKNEFEDWRVKMAFDYMCRIVHSTDVINEQEVEDLTSTAYKMLFGNFKKRP